MAKWQVSDNLTGSIKVELTGIENTLKTIDGIITIIDKYNTAIADIVNVVSTITSLPSVDPNLIALQELQKTIKKQIQDFIGQGLFMLPIFPSDYTGDGLDSVKGGISSFKEKIISSFDDMYDKNRPVFSDTAYSAGIVVMFDSGNTINDYQAMVDTFEATTSLLKVFNVFQNDYKLKIAPIENIKTVSADKQIQIQWSVNPKGVPADTYKIYRYLLASTENIANVEVKLSDMKEIGTVYIQQNQPYIFIDNDVLNDIQYLYKIVPYLAGNLFTEEPEIPQFIATAKASNFVKSEKCSNLGCNFIDGKTQYFCLRNNPSFNFDAFNNSNANDNGARCLVGTLPCDEYTNKQCKFDDGQKCTSWDTTISKNRGYDKAGEIIPINNTSLYISKYCKDGTNAQYCDGYIEKKTYFQGTPPNWSSLTAKNFFPNELSQVTDYLTSFVDSLVSTTQKADYAISLLGTEIASAGQSLKDTIVLIRDTIESLNSIFSISIPSMYVLEIGTQVGGNQAFINSLRSATSGPTQNEDAYDLGFVLYMGSTSEIAVNSFYSFFSKHF